MNTGSSSTKGNVIPFLGVTKDDCGIFRELSSSLTCADLTSAVPLEDTAPCTTKLKKPAPRMLKDLIF
jgi:hypothetical protein